MSKVTPMNYEGDPSKNWIKWRRSFERYRATQDWNDSSQEIVAMKFIVAFGEKALGICLQLNLTQKEMSDYDTLMLKFEEHFVSRKNLTQHRHVLFNQKQDKAETIEEYSALLNRLSEKCEFGDQTDDIIKMVFISGIKDDICRKKLLESERTWEEVVNYAMLAEHINKTCTEMCDKANVSKPNADKEKSQKSENKGGDKKGDKGEKKYCTFCGQKHERRNCPAYNKVCGICKKQNHFAKMCKNKKPEGFVMV